MLFYKGRARRFAVTQGQLCVSLLWRAPTGEQGAGAWGRPEGTALLWPTRLSEEVGTATKGYACPAAGRLLHPTWPLMRERGVGARGGGGTHRCVSRLWALCRVRQTTSSLLSHLATCWSTTARFLVFSPSFASGVPLGCIKRSHCSPGDSDAPGTSLARQKAWHRPCAAQALSQGPARFSPGGVAAIWGEGSVQAVALLCARPHGSMGSEEGSRRVQLAKQVQESLGKSALVLLTEWVDPG